MKGKCLIIILLMTITIPIVYGATTCQVSLDNTTWVDITNIMYGGEIDDIEDKAYIQNLNDSTTYYIRCRDSDTRWGYISQETKSGGLDEKMIATMMGIVFVAGLFIWFAFKMEEEHFLLKLLLIFFSLVTILLIPATIINGVDSIAPVFLKVVGGFFTLFILYFVIYLVYHWTKRSEAWLKIRGKQ